MTLQSYPMIIPIYSRSGGDSLSEHDIKVIIGMWIVINALWSISWIITFAKYFKSIQLESYTKYGIVYTRSSCDSELVMAFDVIMVIIWGMIVLGYAGAFIANIL